MSWTGVAAASSRARCRRAAFATAQLRKCNSDARNVPRTDILHRRVMTRAQHQGAARGVTYDFCAEKIATTEKLTAQARRGALKTCEPGKIARCRGRARTEAR